MKICVGGAGFEISWTLIIRYLFVNFQTGEFPLQHIPTVFETAITSMAIDDKEIELTLWDTAGQESYDRLRPLSYSQTDVILICFSIDR